MTEDRSNPNQAPRPRWLRGAIIGGSALAVVAVAGVGVSLAQDRAFRADRMGDFAAWRIERALEDVGASEEARRTARETVRSTEAELAREMQGFRDFRAEIRGLMTAETVDRDAVEALRAERMAALDAASRRAAEAMLDIAETLEPEQRSALADMIEERRSETRGERRGPRGPWQR